jgi:hypothetical protein
MSTAFGAGHRVVPEGQGRGAPRCGAVGASASKVHPVAVIAEHVEGPIGRQRRRSAHAVKNRPGSVASGKLAG